MDWTIADGLDLIRGIQQDTRKYGYHVCLGGGVLNKGQSKKDLDLYFISLDNNGKPKPDELIKWLESMWGKSESMWQDYVEDINSGGLDADVPIGPSIVVAVEDANTSGRILFDRLERSDHAWWRNQQFTPG